MAARRAVASAWSSADPAAYPRQRSTHAGVRRGPCRHRRARGHDRERGLRAPRVPARDPPSGCGTAWGSLAWATCSPRRGRSVSPRPTRRDRPPAALLSHAADRAPRAAATPAGPAPWPARSASGCRRPVGATPLLWEALATLGAVDLTVARVVEPHLDALAILEQSGGDAADERRSGSGASTPRKDHPRGWRPRGRRRLAAGGAQALVLPRRPRRWALVTAWVDEERRRLFAVDLTPAASRTCRADLGGPGTPGGHQHRPRPRRGAGRAGGSSAVVPRPSRLRLGRDGRGRRLVRRGRGRRPPDRRPGGSAPARPARGDAPRGRRRRPAPGTVRARRGSPRRRCRPGRGRCRSPPRAPRAAGRPATAPRRCCGTPTTPWGPAPWPPRRSTPRAWPTSTCTSARSTRSATRQHSAAGGRRRARGRVVTPVRAHVSGTGSPGGRAGPRRGGPLAACLTSVTGRGNG